jgi:ubiquinone/menaquinone biosynthesis C-methylase UbiE
MPKHTTQAGRQHDSVGERAAELVTALSMTVARGRVARAVADAADLTADDRVVDIGCGPGTAARLAAARAADVVGVDPSPLMLDLARRISRLRGPANVSWREGSAEAVPLADGQATVVWSLSSVHHWTDCGSALREIGRVLERDGRVLLVERLVAPGARGHAAHGLTREQADDLAEALRSEAFTGVHVDLQRVGHRTLVVVRATRDAAA